MIKTALAIGRWMPIHLGHKQFLTDLARKFDRLVIGIGSCYENGTPRNCIPAIEREKLLRRIFKSEGLTNVIIVPVEDRPTFEEWFSDVIKLCEKYDVTHFCTGNKEDILNVMKEKDLTLNAEMINPEDKSNFPYHATDVRNAILRGDMHVSSEDSVANVSCMIGKVAFILGIYHFCIQSKVLFLHYVQDILLVSGAEMGDVVFFAKLDNVRKPFLKGGSVLHRNDYHVCESLAFEYPSQKLLSFDSGDAVSGGAVFVARADSYNEPVKLSCKVCEKLLVSKMDRHPSADCQCRFDHIIPFLTQIYFYFNANSRINQ